MFYSIRHVTRFRYSAEVSESIMEVRMQPRSDTSQRCLSFQLSVTPRTRVTHHRDYLGNTVHHFDVPGGHTQLIILAEALVDVQLPQSLPYSLPDAAWDDLDLTVNAGDFWDMLQPSQYSKPTPALIDLAKKLGVERRSNPLQFLRELNTSMFHWFDYVPQSTKVDSPIDEAIEARKGVCQDFAHIMIALCRYVGIPARYVSGYLFHRSVDHDRSSDGATHAWVEAFLPGLGWIGLDPTNNLIVGERHVRTAMGRDYADVPPTRGVFKGNAEQALSVSVHVAQSDSLPPLDEEIIMSDEDWSVFQTDQDEMLAAQQQAQQQQ